MKLVSLARDASLAVRRQGNAQCFSWRPQLCHCWKVTVTEVFSCKWFLCEPERHPLRQHRGELLSTAPGGELQPANLAWHDFWMLCLLNESAQFS